MTNISSQISERQYENTTRVTIANNSYTIQFNPAVINSNADGATISNLVQEVVIQTDGEVDNANVEWVGDKVYYTRVGWGLSPYFVSSRNRPFPIVEGVWLRVSFDVTPNNNPAAKTKVIKTFVCQIQ
jgi:hypothetical protein